VLETPVFGPVQQEQPNIYIVTPGSAPAASSTAAPTRPPVVAGTVPEQTVADLAAHGGRFDRTVVSVDGTAQAVQQTTDGRGNPITTFRLEAGGASVEVLVWGRVAVRNGETVRASGPWHGVIEAETVER
jgi:hypothetical protein